MTKDALPAINDNATRAELDKMVEDMIKNGLIDLRKASIPKRTDLLKEVDDNGRKTV